MKKKPMNVIKKYMMKLWIFKNYTKTTPDFGRFEHSAKI